MKTVQLKSQIHEIVDRIQSEQLLQALYDFLKTREQSIPGQSWETLSDVQKQEVLASFNESEDEENLIDANSIFTRR
jgi:hypothetical protein